MTPRGKYLVSVIGVVCGFVLLAHVVLFAGFTVDDAFISFRYAENFASGKGLVFNPGERVEGYSNFLWVLILGILAKAGINVILASKVIGLLSLLAVIAGVYALVRRITGESLYAAGSLVLMTTSFGLLFFSVTGMETVFYAALLTWGGYIFHRNESRLSPGLALISIAVALTRPEGVLFFPILAIFELIKYKRPTKRLLGAVAIFFGSLAVFLLWRYQYYGFFLPNTYYAKPPKASTALPPVVSGLDDIYRCFTANGGPLLLVSLLLLVLKAETRKTVYPLLPVVATVFVFQCYSGGDWMENYRFLVPMLPVYFVVGVYAIRWILNRSNLRRNAVVFLTIVVILGLFNVGESAEFYLKREKYPNFVMTSKDLIPAAKWVGDNYPADYAIVCLRIGALAYFSKLDLIDIKWGLTDKFIAHKRHRGELSDAVQDEYARERNPELIMEGVNEGTCLKETIEMGGRTYVLVRHFRQGSQHRWVLYERQDLRDASG